MSLGYNCEVSFRINDYLEREIDSYPLSWAYVFEQSRISNIDDRRLYEMLKMDSSSYRGCAMITIVNDINIFYLLFGYPLVK